MKFVEEIGEEEKLEKIIPDLELLLHFGFDEDFYNLLVKSNGEIEEEYEGWAVSEWPCACDQWNADSSQ